MMADFLLDVVTTSRRVIGDENDDEEIDETETSEEVGEDGAIIIVFIRHDESKGVLLVCWRPVVMMLFCLSSFLSLFGFFMASKYHSTDRMKYFENSMIRKEIFVHTQR